jgi:dihydrodipicolinate synthase/N-acetylneuraminate lyase
MMTMTTPPRKTRLILDGIVPILQTPFLETGEPDIESLDRLVDHVIKAGAVGVIYPAVASEVGKLTSAERRRVVEVVAARIGNRIPLIVGVSSGSIESSLELARHAAPLGAAGVLAQAPEEIASHPGRTREFFTALANGVRLDLMIQDLDWRGTGMELGLIQELFETLPNFRSIKVETVAAGPKYTRILEATQGRLHVAGGWAITQMLDGLERGVHAFMPEGSMVRIYHAIFSRFAAGDRDGARLLFERLLPVLAFSNQHLDVSIHFFKRLLVAKGIFRTATVREPIIPLDAVQERTAATLVSRVIALERELPSLSTSS